MDLKSKGEIVIYKPKGQTVLFKVQLEQDTVWLTQAQIVKLFQSSKANISEHIKHIYKTGELVKKSTVRKFRTVQIEGKRTISRELEYYNLDMIISVGYRVNSKKGTQFRIWATRVLKDHIIKGYSINEKRLKEQNERLKELQKTANMMGKLLESKKLAENETRGLLQVITDYSYALTLLDDYDFQRLKIQDVTKKKESRITFEMAKKAIEELGIQMDKKQGKALFGIEKDKSFDGSLNTIYQTFDGKELYPSLEEKAAHLLYFVVKNHSFVDGNKRIGAFLFIWFLDINGLLYIKEGRKRLSDNTLVALTLLIAESNPKDKDTIIKIIVNLINKKN